MTKKTFTLLYLLLSTLANILLTMLVITLLGVVSFVVLRFVFHVSNSSVFAADLMICLVGGFVLSFLFFNKLSAFVIQKAGWENKFDESLFRFRMPNGVQKKTEETPKRKTNMPSSVLEEDDE